MSGKESIHFAHELVHERDLPTKESPILAILLLIAISLSLAASLPLNMVSRDAKPDQRRVAVNES